MSITSTNEAIASAQRILEAFQEDAGVSRAILAGDKRVARLGLDGYNKQNIIRCALVKQMWQKIGRQVLAVHPAVVDEVKLATSDKIPAEVLRTLPYMNPLVVFAEPPEFKTWMPKGEMHPATGRPEVKMRLLGFFTYGISNAQIKEDDGRVRLEQRIYSTNAVEAERFGMMLMLEALDDNGRVIDVELNSMSIYFNENLTLGETVDDLMDRFHWAVSDAHQGATTKKWMRQVLGVVMGSLFYLCSTTLEAEEVPRKYTARRVPRSVSRKPLSMFKIGWTTGAALTRYRQSRTYSTSEQSDITHTQDPQHRRAHFKMQPCGPGLIERKLIFVSAYWTHVEALGEAGVNTARGVPRVNGKGAARESVRTALTTGIPAEVQ